MRRLRGRLPLGPPAPALEQPPELVSIESGIFEDAVERLAPQLLVHRDGEEDMSLGMPEADVTATLSSHLPTMLLEGADQPSARDDRQSPGHAGNGNLRRTTPSSIDRPCSRRPST